MFDRVTFRKLFALFIFILLFQLLILTLLYIYSDFKSIHSWISQKSSEDKQKHSCKIDQNQAISALNRIKTDLCRRNLYETYCLIHENKPWPDRLRSSCKNLDQNNYRKLISCQMFHSKILNYFLDEKSNKILSINSTDDQWCVDLCLQIDFEFALFHQEYCICTNNLQSLINHSSPTNCDHKCAINLRNCPNHLYIFRTGIKKINYHLPELSIINENDFIRPKIVFLLLLSGRSVYQVHRLLKNIYDEYHFYYIHVDLYDNYMFYELLHLESKFSNIKLSRRRFNTIWGGSSLLTAILSCISEIFDLWHSDWDFLLNLSESGFPLKKIHHLEKYLAKNYEKNFIKSHGKNTFDFIRTQALNKVFVQCERRMWRIADRQLIKGIIWDGGSDWVILSRNFSHYLVYSNEDSFLNGLKNFFQYSLLPAESFFHVVLRNSEFCQTIVNNNLHATNWNRKKGCKCQQKSVVDWCGCSPNVFRVKDMSRLTSTYNKPLFFGRKFDPVIDSEIIDFVELRFLDNNFSLEDWDKNFYMQNIYKSTIDPLDDKNDFRIDFYKHFIHKFSNDVISKSINDVKLLESNILFKDGQFFGSLLQFSHETTGKFDLILKPYLNQTILFNYSFLRIKSIKVCNYYDEKEEVFRDFECLISETTPLLQILHEWQPFFGLYEFFCVLLDTENRIASMKKIVLNNNKTEENELKFLLKLKTKSYTLKPGLWKLIILDREFIYAFHRFLVIKSKRNDEKVEHRVTENLDQSSELLLKVHSLIEKYPEFFAKDPISFDKLWHIHAVCHHQTNDLVFQLKSCDQVNWSVDNLKSRLIF